MSGEEKKDLTPEEQAKAKADEYRQKFEAGVEPNEPTGREGDTPAGDQPVKPEHVPEKFWNAETGEVNYEAWNNAHTELETKFHQGNKDDAAAGNDPADTGDKSGDGGDTPEGDKDEVVNALETPAAQAAATEYAEKGELSDATYSNLEKAGFTRDMVDSYIAGQEAQANAVADAAFTPAGGEEGYAAMIGWAKENLEPAEIRAFNTQIKSGDLEVIGAAVKNLHARYAENADIEGDRLGGGAGGSEGGAFGSRAEMTAAINKVNDAGQRLYDVDPAYRQAVIARIGKSRSAGTI